MNIKNTTVALLLLFSANLFAQDANNTQSILKIVPKISYLDSIKKTFVNDKVAARVDSLWMKELTDLDLFSSFSEEIKNTNLDVAIDYELPTDILKQRLAAMDAKSPFNIEYNPGLENLIKSFLKNRKKSFERLMAVSEYYFPLMEEALAKQNVPLEIKYLAVVESALNPKAVSRMGATGLWQFMYQTGKQYGLKIDSYVDERSDPLKSSEAATQYMTNMYKIFGDWDLVLAAYNSGPGNVAKAIRRSGGQQNYWNIRKNLPRETQSYVPAFLATMYIYEYHKEHGIVPNRAKVKHFATDTVMIKRQMTFRQISDLLDVPVAQLQLLNPSYKLNVVPFYHDQTHFLRLPQEKVAVFASNEDKIYAYAQYEKDKSEKPFMLVKTTVVKDSLRTNTESLAATKSVYYKVRKGDNIASVALKYGVTIAEIKKWNHIKGNNIAYGRSLKINTDPSTVNELKSEPKNTVYKNTALADAKVNKEEKAVDASNTASSYVVQKGDNLGSIAKKHNLTVTEIQKLNGLTTASVQAGLVLQLSPKETDAKPDAATSPLRKDVEYVVLKGDNLGAIATKFGATVPELKSWNNLPDNTITIGKSLIVAKDEIAINTDKATVDTFKTKKNTSAAKTASEYFVKKGDSLFSISKKYPGVTINDLKKWNGISGEDIKPGMKLKING
ncbi:LysM peptidoglycan-binding domain-containing protein [Flavobacterium sp. FPG59]|jgi:membrane-bound lytic murein transglycosylase D|uniref:LysM peptidoglycan-binding domain-containing protein n=1 Tax=Flavobacterium sp. FPG59 TaxID=1929267 RepID=UPI000A3CC084|nr:LysM peptidoglycan-binding domain-containing protein [Flavobacterium sp. FPG59]OUD37493.1 lytic transglycosylase [Flavobacterium sp. FPG59]